MLVASQFPESSMAASVPMVSRGPQLRSREAWAEDQLVIAALAAAGPLREGQKKKKVPQIAPL